MGEYDQECIDVFLENQTQLFPEPVAETPEEAVEFFEECMAVVCDDIEEMRGYFEDNGIDVDNMDDDELTEQLEVFRLPSGRFLVVQG